MPHPEHYAREARRNGHVFPLTFFTDHGPRVIDAFLLRHRNHDGSPDDFTAHLATTGEFLGEGDTKADAVSDARCALHQWVDFGIPYNGSDQTVTRDLDALRMPERPEG